MAFSFKVAFFYCLSLDLCQKTPYIYIYTCVPQCNPMVHNSPINYMYVCSYFCFLCLMNDNVVSVIGQSVSLSLNQSMDRSINHTHRVRSLRIHSHTFHIAMVIIIIIIDN